MRALQQQGGQGRHRGGDAGHGGHPGSKGVLRPADVRGTGRADFGRNPEGVAGSHQAKEKGAGLPALPAGAVQNQGGNGNRKRQQTRRDTQCIGSTSMRMQSGRKCRQSDTKQRRAKQRKAKESRTEGRGICRKQTETGASGLRPEQADAQLRGTAADPETTAHRRSGRRAGHPAPVGLRKAGRPRVEGDTRHPLERDLRPGQVPDCCPGQGEEKGQPDVETAATACRRPADRLPAGGKRHAGRATIHVSSHPKQKNQRFTSRKPLIINKSGKRDSNP